MCTMCMPGTLVGQEKASDPLELELEEVTVSYLIWVLEIERCFSVNVASTLNSLPIASLALAQQLKILIFILLVGVLFARVSYVPCVLLMPTEVTKGHQVP